MITTLRSIDELKEAKKALADLQDSYPILCEKFVHVAGLTRSLQLKYQYMGCLIMDENSDDCLPNIPYSSVLRLYKREVKMLKNDEHIGALKELFQSFKETGYAKISLLALGRSPESLIGASSIK
ncbi:hypothetical protein [Domibacillus robiginosus]|uniref:hypothetical protein n=1 Tax=Domibacillus robiginosus TaxID=1071054 RepID=UPI00067B5A04|nr:hypothetical protein [Domibacillus robiginosus]